MSCREVTNHISTQRNNTASQLPDPPLFVPQFVSTPKEGNKDDRSGEGAGEQLDGDAESDLVK